MTRNRILLAILLIGGTFFLIGRAWGTVWSNPSPRLWPGKYLNVYNASQRKTSVEQAVRTLNQVGLPIKLRLVSRPEYAQVGVWDVTRFSKDCSGSGVVGCAPKGYRESGKSWVQLIKPTEENPEQPQFSQVVVHEFMHVLGMEHRKGGCQMMNPEMCEPRNYFRPEQGCPVDPRYGLSPTEWCSGVSTSRYLCRPTVREAQELLRIYGGKLPAGYSPWCSKTEAIVWAADCIYPQWHSRNNIFPAQIDPGSKTCSSSNPRFFWEPLKEAQLAARRVWRKHPSSSLFREIHRLDRMAQNCPKGLCLPKWHR